MKVASPGNSFALGSLIAIAVRGVLTVVELIYVAAVTALGRRQGWSIHTGVLHASPEEEAERREAGPARQRAEGVRPTRRAIGPLYGGGASSVVDRARWVGAGLRLRSPCRPCRPCCGPRRPRRSAADIGLPRVAPPGPAAPARARVAGGRPPARALGRAAARRGPPRRAAAEAAGPPARPSGRPPAVHRSRAAYPRR